jgi:hypothetical protein
MRKLLLLRAAAGVVAVVDWSFWPILSATIFRPGLGIPRVLGPVVGTDPWNERIERTRFDFVSVVVDAIEIDADINNVDSAVSLGAECGTRTCCVYCSWPRNMGVMIAASSPRATTRLFAPKVEDTSCGTVR